MIGALTLVVLRCADIDASAVFYRALGLNLKSEKHGSGPRHWSATIGPTVLELYPERDSGGSVTRIGFSVRNVEAAVAAAASIGARIHHTYDPNTGRAVVVDPDGIKIELSTEP